MKIKELKVDYLNHPVGIENAPYLSWYIQSDFPNTMQNSYSIIISDRNNEEIYKSGIIESEQSINIVCDMILQPFSEYCCSIEVMDNQGNKASEQCVFETGRIDVPWKAKWITANNELDDDGMVPPYHFIKNLELSRPVIKARVYASCLGCYNVLINGKDISKRYFAPGYTQYTDRVFYNIYDVSDYVSNGSIVVDAEVSGGWYAGRLGLALKRNRFGKKRALILELHVWYEDGSEEVFGTDEDWSYTTDGPRRFADFFDGEIYDARREDETDWQLQAAILFDGIVPAIEADNGVPVVKHSEVAPIAIYKSKNGDQILDFGRNFAGIVCLKNFHAPKGQKILIRHAEVLQDGELYTKSLRTAKAELQYICSEGGQSYEPKFTYMGFRFISIHGYEARLEDITAYEIYSDLEQVGEFSCSNEMLNQLQNNIITSQKANFVDIPTDCPQRDERCGWTGDIALFACTAVFNMHTNRFLGKWLRDLELNQNNKGVVPMIVPDSGFTSKKWDNIFSLVHLADDAAWGDAAVIVPWTIYMATGDTRILKNQYSSMIAWVEYERRQAAKLLSIGKKRYIWSWGFHFGDWLAPGQTMLQNMKKARWTSTAYYANSVHLLSHIAGVLGFQDDKERYIDLYSEIKKAFNKILVDKKGHIKKGFQSIYALALHFDLVDGMAKKNAIEDLIQDIKKHDYHLTTGFVGTPYLTFAVSDNGFLDVAYQLLLQKTCPSWLYPITCGATSIWERWDSLMTDGSVNEEEMVSFNHYAYGAVGDWMYRRIAGIEPVEAGYKKVQICPMPGGGLTWAKGSHVSPYGVVKSSWRLENDSFILEVEIPCNTSARIILPNGEQRDVGSGHHQFTVVY